MAHSLYEELLAITEVLEAKLGPVRGDDGHNIQYERPINMWCEYVDLSIDQEEHEEHEDEKENNERERQRDVVDDTTLDHGGWYEQGVGYWEKEENCPSSNEGVLGGFPELHDPDVEMSLHLLQSLSMRKVLMSPITSIAGF